MIPCDQAIWAVRSMLRRIIPLILFVILFLFFSCSKRDPAFKQSLIQAINEEDLHLDTDWVDMRPSSDSSPWRLDWIFDAKDAIGGIFATLHTRRGAIEFQCLEVSPRQIVLRWRKSAESAGIQRVIFFVNDQWIRNERVPQEFHEMTLSVPATYLQPGINYLTLYPYTNDVKLDAAIDVEYVRILKEPSKVDEPDLRHDKSTSELFTWKQESDGTVIVPSTSVLNLCVRVPKDAYLEAEWGLMENFSLRGSSALFNIYIDDGHEKTEIASSEVKYGLLFPPKDGRLLNLSLYGNQIVRIVLEARAVHGKPVPSRVFWKNVNLLYSQENFQKENPAAGIHKMKNRPNVIIYVMDALRPDHLESYGYSKSTSPEIRNFADQSVLLTNCYSQSSWTRAAVASIQSGLYPSSHLTEGRQDSFPSDIPTIQWELKRGGYSTYGVATNGNISRWFHFSSHFDEYIQLPESLVKRQIHKRSDEVIASIERLLDRYSQPAFLYVHATDTHAPYTAEKRFLKIPENCHANEAALYNPSAGKYGIEFYDRKIVECVVALYDSEIRQSDYYFGKFIDLLKQRGLYHNSLVILTADHGEEFLEHGQLGHGKNLYQSSIRVPLIIHFPEERFAGARVNGMARHIDLFPTILELLGLKIPIGVEGVSLLPLIAGLTTKSRPVFSELSLDGPPTKAMILDKYKLIATQGEFLGRKRNSSSLPREFRDGIISSPSPYSEYYQLYNLQDDPQEMTNLFDKQPIISGYMRTLLTDWVVSQEKSRKLRKKGPAAILDEESRETLRGLGYLQ